MSNYVKYIPSPRPDLTGSLFKDNVALNIKSTADGPTSTTGWFSGITPETDKFVIYQVYASSNDPDIFTPQSDDELYRLATMKGATGSEVNSVSGSLGYLCSQPTFLPTNFDYEDIVLNDLVFLADAGFVGSMPQMTGYTNSQPYQTWYDLSGKNNNGTYSNLLSGSGDPTIIFDQNLGAESGSLTFLNGTYTNFGSNSSLIMPTGSMNIWVKNNFNQSAGYAALFCKFKSYNLFLSSSVYIGPPTTFESLLTVIAYDATSFAFTEYVTDVVIGDNWYYITLVFDSTSATTGNSSSLYVNGIEINYPRIYMTEFSSDFPLLVAASNDGTLPPPYFDQQTFRGSVGCVSVYNRKLKPEEITQNYNAQKARYGIR
jgi:hypothetical protein